MGYGLLHHRRGLYSEAIIGLLLSVTVDRLRWTAPFWAGCLFVYIFVHAFAGTAYIKSIATLDLFSWINLSVIFALFLFAIPAYFAKD